MSTRGFNNAGKDYDILHKIVLIGDSGERLSNALTKKIKTKLWIKPKKV